MSTDPTVIVAGARTPMGRMSGSLKGFSGSDLGGFAIKGALEKAGVAPRGRRLRDHGPGAHGRRGPDPRPPGRDQGRHPDDRAGAHHQQGLPVRHRRHRARRPADPRGGVRGRRRRRPGVDDQRAAPAREEPRRLQVRRRDAARPHGAGRPVGRLHRPGDGPAHRVGQHRRPRVHPRGAGRLLGPQPPARRPRVEGRPVRRRGRHGHHPAAPGRRPGVPHRRGHPRRHHHRVARPPAPGLQQGRHHHGRLGLADLRRRRRGGRHEEVARRVSSA